MSEKSPEQLCEEAQGLVSQGQPDDAIPLFQQALEQNGDFVPAHEGLAMAYALASDWEGGEKHFAKLIQIQPLQARHYINLGTMYNRKGDYQKAVDTLRRALQRDRKNANCYFSIGLSYRKLKQTALSVSAYKEAIKLDPEFAEAYLNLANVLVDMGSLQQAVQMFRKALDLRPKLDKARRGLEKAQEALVKAKQMESPFGRLVDAEKRAKSVPSLERELSSEEREDDRKAIRVMMESLETLIRDCREHLDNVLAAKLHDLHVCITSSERGLALTHVSNELREASDRWTDLRQLLRRKVLELRAHEELITTPEFRIDR